MPGLSRTLTCVALLLVLSGCAPDDAASSPVPDDGTVMVEEFRHLATGDSTEEIVELGDNTSLPWAVNLLDTNSSVLYIAYVAGVGDSTDCGPHLGVVVEETEEAVVITAVSSARASGINCSGDPRIEGGAVELESALGARTLMHAAVSPPWDRVDSPLVTEEPAAIATPTITGAPYSGTATCETLIGETAYADYTARGFTDFSADFTQRVATQPQLGELFDILQWSGIVCQLAHGDATSTVYGYGPISAEQGTEKTEQLDGAGFALTAAGGFDRYTNASGETEYAFGDGYWALSYNNGGGGVLDQIVEHAPQF